MQTICLRALTSVLGGVGEDRIIARISAPRYEVHVYRAVAATLWKPTAHTALTAIQCTQP